MTDDDAPDVPTPKTDPLDRVADLRPKDGMTREEIAVAAWEAAGAMMAALAGSADDTAAKNYVAIQFHGFAKRLPFDRAEVHLLRPGGLTPAELVHGNAETIEHLRDQLRRAREELVERREEATRFYAANAEIAKELANRILGENAIVGEERFMEVINAVQQSCSALRDANAMLEGKNAVVIRSIKTMFDAAVVCDPQATCDAIAKVKADLVRIGVTL